MCFLFDFVVRCSEVEMIEKIVVDILNVLNDFVLLNYCDFLVGVGVYMEKMRFLLSLECDEVRMVGIWGFVGIGKIIIVRVLYENFCSNFIYIVFMESLKGGYIRNYFENYEYML